MEFIKLKLFCRMTVVSLLLVFALPACSLSPRVQERVLNTPEHHAYSGYKFLERAIFSMPRENSISLCDSILNIPVRTWAWV